MRIERPRYLDALKARMGNGMVKVITGLRRVGKSFLVFEIFRDFLLESGVDGGRIVALALDDLENERYRDPRELYRYVLDRIGDDAGPYYVLLDEVQYAISESELRDKDNPPALYGVLNGLMRRRNVDVYVTGSNSKLLSRDVMTEFRGRGDEVHVFPLSFAEFLAACPLERSEAWERYVAYGGLPLAATMADDAQRARYLEGLFEEVYLTDVVSRNRVEKTQELEDLVDVLASGIGSLTNPSKIASTFESVLRSRIDAKTVKNYIGYLEEAFLVCEATRYDVRGRRYIGTPKKYYFEDVGLRNARLGFRQVEPTHIMENVLFNELRMRGYSVDVGVVERREASGGRDRRVKREVDFVANLGSRRYYVQSAYRMETPEKAAQEKASLLGIGDSFKKIVVVRDPVVPLMDGDGILTMGLFDFLLDPDSLER